MITDALELLSDENFMLPLFRFPTLTSYRTDRLGGAVEADLDTDRAVPQPGSVEDVNGDGQIDLGADQFPRCLNPVTACADSPWFRVLDIQTLPGIWRTTNEQTYERTDLVVGEPVVEAVGG